MEKPEHPVQTVVELSKGNPEIINNHKVILTSIGTQQAPHF